MVELAKLTVLVLPNPDPVIMDDPVTRGITTNTSKRLDPLGSSNLDTLN